MIKTHQVEATVVRIIATQLDMQEEQLKEPGIFLTTKNMDLIFWPMKQVNDAIELVSRGETVKPFSGLDQLS